MAEFTSAAEAPAARAVIYMMGFDHDMVQHALAQAGGNEQLAINLILNGEVHDVATASSSVASIASRAVSFSGPPFGFGTAFAPAKVASCSSSSSSSSDDELSSSMSGNVLAISDRLTGRRVFLALVADGKLQLPAQLRVQLMRPLELIKAAAWFFARQSPGTKRHREEPPPPLGHMLTEFSPCVPVRVMCGCVATACRRLVTASAGMRMFYRTTGRCLAAWIMERVTRGHVERVQVRLQRHVCCHVHWMCVSASLRCVFNACCSKRWMVFRCVAAHRSGCIKRAVAFILVCRLLLPPALQAGPTLWNRQQSETALRCFAM
jgi:hypothetical protein